MKKQVHELFWDGFGATEVKIYTDAYIKQQNKQLHRTLQKGQEDTSISTVSKTGKHTQQGCILCIL